MTPRILCNFCGDPMPCRTKYGRCVPCDQLVRQIYAAHGCDSLGPKHHLLHERISMYRERADNGEPLFAGVSR